MARLVCTSTDTVTRADRSAHRSTLRLQWYPHRLLLAQLNQSEGLVYLQTESVRKDEGGGSG